MSYFPSISQSVTVDTNNSEVGATIANYTGATDIWHYNNNGTSTLGVNAIQIVVTSDKNLTIYVDQGRANNSFQVTDTYDYLTTKQFGITVQAVGAYVRVRAKNTSGASATATIDTVLCPIATPEPRSLDAQGNFQVGIKSIEDLYGFEAENTPMGEMRMVVPTRLVGAQFDGSTLDTNFWTATATAGGTATTAGANLTMATNTTANGAIAVTSVRRARYVSANALGYRSAIRLEAGATNNKRRWGAAMHANYSITITSASIVAGDVYTNNSQQFIVLNTATTTTMLAQGTGNPGAGTQTYTKVSGSGPATLTGSAFASTATPMDGAWFQLNGTTFSVVTAKGGSETAVDSGSFNGDLGATYSPGTTITTYEIYWTNSKVYFVIGGKLLHTVSASSATWANTMSLNIFMDNVNSGGSTTAVNMFCRVASIRRMGPLHTLATSKNITTAGTYILKYGPGKLNRVILSSTNGTITLYDGLSAVTVLSTLTISGSTALPCSIEFDTPFFNGLTVVTSANSNITVIYE